jgi:hypothetical protein
MGTTDRTKQLIELWGQHHEGQSPFVMQATEWPPPQSPEEVEMAFYEKFFLSKELEPYPVQEEAFNHIFAEHNILVMVPTGTGKTMIAKSALMKALHTQKTAIYTTPLRALTEEKYREFCADFGAQYVGFATGDYKINPTAPIQVMVAEIVWNMIYSGHRYAPADILIMDEGHYFNDPERGYVWEQSIIGLDPSTQLIILSATVGNPLQFCQWTYLVRGTPMELVQSDIRRIPLYHKYEEAYLIEQVRELQKAEEVPAIIFTFGRKQCFEYARLLKSCRRFTTEEEQKEIAERAAKVIIPRGISDQLTSLLTHGIGIHHAGILPAYKQLIEELTLDRLLKFVVSTETISAGINLPAKRVIFPALRKHIRKRSRVLLPAEYHQMAGRAGRPQFDSEGIAISLAPEDVVQEIRKERKEAEKYRRTYDEAKIRKRAYARARSEAQRREDVIWDEEVHQQIVQGTSAPLSSHTKITAEQILAIGLPDLTQHILPGVALVEAERQAKAKAEAERQEQLERQLKKKQEREAKKADKKKKGFGSPAAFASLGALIANAPKAEKSPEPAEDTPDTTTDTTPDTTTPENTTEPKTDTDVTTDATTDTNTTPKEHVVLPNLDDFKKASEEPTEAIEESATSEGAEASEESVEVSEAPAEDETPAPKGWPAGVPREDVLSLRLSQVEGTPWPKDAALPPPLISHQVVSKPTTARFHIATIIDKLFISDNDKREAHKLLAKITNNLRSLGIINEKGVQCRGWLVGSLRGIDGLFVYYCLMHYDLDYIRARELIETIIDHNVIDRLLNRKKEDEKREWMRNKLRERRRDNPQVSWEDVEADYERAFPRTRSFIEQVHDAFLKHVKHPELHKNKRYKEVWATMEDEQHSFMDFVETHKLEQEEGNLFSYLSRIMKTAKMLHEATGLAVFRTVEVRIRRKLAVVDDRILEDLWRNPELLRWG